MASRTTSAWICVWWRTISFRWIIRPLSLRILTKSTCTISHSGHNSTLQRPSLLSSACMSWTGPLCIFHPPLNGSPINTPMALFFLVSNVPVTDWFGEIIHLRPSETVIEQNGKVNWDERSTPKKSSDLQEETCKIRWKTFVTPSGDGMRKKIIEDVEMQRELKRFSES